MNDVESNSPRYVTCRCQHCDGHIEFDANELAEENVVVPCPHCGLETKISVSPLQKQKPTRIPLAKLTAETIRSTTKSGDTPLHRAGKNGKFNEIPSQLLQLELFMVRNKRDETPLHFAAKHGHLNQVPPEFLTKETVTALDYYGRTPLHVAADYGHVDQIPSAFMTREYLTMPTKNFTSNTILHIVAGRNELSKMPSNCVTSEMWNVKNGYGQTPRGTLEDKIRNDAWTASVRNEPATEKQKEKLRYFGCSWEENITKGQASDALEECARKFPDINRAYYNRPVTDEQLAKLRSFGEDPIGDPDDPLTYGQAKDWISQCEIDDHDRVIREMDNG
jgi:hypothetical protein